MTNPLIIFGAKYLIFLPFAVVIYALWHLRMRKVKRIAILAVIALPLSYVVAKACSYLYFDPRPFVVGSFTPLIPHVADNGFPSDHMLLASAIAAITYTFNKRSGILLWIIAAVIGVCRVFAGVHHIVDIVGSVIIALTVVYTVSEWLEWRGYKLILNLIPP